MKKKSAKTEKIHTDSGTAPTTIVGGQPRSKTRKVSIPIGIEQLIYKAAQESEFCSKFLDDPLAAAGQADIELTEFERTTLSHLSPKMLSKMVERFRVPSKRKRRVGKIAAAVALTLASGTAAPGCVDEDDPWHGGDAGVRPDADSGVVLDEDWHGGDAGVRYDDGGIGQEDGGTSEED